MNKSPKLITGSLKASMAVTHNSPKLSIGSINGKMEKYTSNKIYSIIKGQILNGIPEKPISSKSRPLSRNLDSKRGSRTGFSTNKNSMMTYQPTPGTSR